MAETMTLWRPTGPEELDLVRASGWKAWPPRLPDQSIFYPVLNEQYAIMIARDWNVPASGVGYVTRFDADRDSRPVTRSGRQAGATSLSCGCWPRISTKFNQHIVGQIEVVHEFRPDSRPTG
ncbi:hypothetical protein Strop_4133 [Salinispora tropica CNB-440]|uniref:ADP-ribosylation/crystallin J1 n=1 Tax=Salinispora tropica (strain ATCC BAA-916 / DSM 44818 / JCM 13857 / NBRC 105044 / CNB-440) TaxID=369723 RepID=A4XCA5_SALTO|nr:hypothetical protein Strop_4133 [Salinispora tropica CNB-440]